MAIENIILNSALSSVNGLDSKAESYIQGVQVWVISLTNIRVQGRANNAKGLNSIMYKGGFMTTASYDGQHTSWPYLWFSGGAKWTAYRKVTKVTELMPIDGTMKEVTTLAGETYPLTDLRKVHEGEVVPYNIKLSLTGNLLAGLFSEAKEQKQSQSMSGAFQVLEKRMKELTVSHGEVQLHVTVGLSPETYAASSVKAMYKSSPELEDRMAFEVQLQDRDVLGVKWVLPGEKTFVPGLHLGQIVNLVSEQYIEKEVQKDVLSPDEVLPKDAQVIRYLNKNYGKFVKDGGFDHSLVETRKKFLATLTGSFLKWAQIEEKEAKALEALANWSPAGKAGPRTMGKTVATPTENLEKAVATPVVETPKKEEEVVASVAKPRASRMNRGVLGSIAEAGAAIVSSMGDDEDEDLEFED